MPKQTWLLLDEMDNIRADDWSANMGPSSACCRVLSGGKREGVQQITLDNGCVAIEVLPTRGMGVWQAMRGDVPFGWKSPIRGPVHPMWVPIDEPSGLGWLDGFDEMLVRCGLTSNGAPEFDEHGRLKYPLHGRIANQPSHHVSLTADDDGTLQLIGVVDDTRFLFHSLRLTSRITLRPGSPEILIEDTVENQSHNPATMQLLYHLNFGPPVLDDGAEITVPADDVVARCPHAANSLDSWNRYGPPQAGSVEQVYFFQPRADSDGFGHALLRNSKHTAAVHVAFDTRTLPCFTLWKNTSAMADGYVTGLEPATNYPNPHSFESERGRVVQLEPSGSVTYRLRITCMNQSDEIEVAMSEINTLASPSPTLHHDPPPGWVAG